MKKLRVLLIGSQRDGPTDNFRTASGDLAVALAPSAAEFILCSTSASTVDRHALAALRERAPTAKVRLVYPSQLEPGSALPDVDAAARQSRPLDVRPLSVRGGWRAAHLHAVQDCDVVVALGGSPRGTGTVIYSADVMGKPVVLLPTHGGAAADAWRDFSPLYTDEERVTLLADSSRPSWAADVANVVRSVTVRNPFRKRRGMAPLLVSLAFAVSGWVLCAWNLGEKSPNGPLLANLMAGLALAAIAGVALGDRERPGSRGRDDLLRWAAVGIGIAFAVFLLEQLASFIVAGNAPLFGLSLEEARGLFARVSGLALLAGLTSDKYIDGFGDKIRNLVG